MHIFLLVREFYHETGEYGIPLWYIIRIYHVLYLLYVMVKRLQPEGHMTLINHMLRSISHRLKLRHITLLILSYQHSFYHAAIMVRL